MADIVIDRSDAQIKTGIEKASDLQSSASEIDGSVMKSAFSRGTVVEKFDSIDGIVQVGDSFDMEILNEETPCASSCLKITSQNGKYIQFEKSISPISIVQAKTLSFYVQTDDPANFGNAAIGLAHSKHGNRTRRFDLSFRPVLTSSNWYHVKMNIDDLQPQNSIARTDIIDYIYFICYPAVDKTSTFKLGGLELDVQEKPAISFTFDDGQLTDYTVGYQKMKEYGFKGTIFQISEAVGLSQRTTFEQITEMYENGWKFGIHGKDGLNWVTETTDEEAEFSIKTCRDYLYNNGFKGNGLKTCAYPQGQYDAATIASLDKLGIEYSRSSFIGVNYYPIVEIRRLMGVAFSSDIDAHKKEIDDLIKTGGHLIYVIHVLDGDIKTTFESLIDYINEKCPEYITTMPDWLEIYSNRINR